MTSSPSVASSSDSGESEDSGPDLMVRFIKIVNYKSPTSTQEAEMQRLVRKLFKFEGLIEISPPSETFRSVTWACE